MKMGIKFTNAQLFIAGLILIGISFLSIGFFPATMINQVYFQEVGVLQYEEGTGVKTFNIVDMISRFGADIPSWVENNKYYTIDGYMMTTHNNNPPTKSLIISIPACSDKIVLNRDNEKNYPYSDGMLTTCSFEGGQQNKKYAFKVLGFVTTASGKEKWTVGVFAPSEILLKKVCEEGEKIYDTCWNGDKIVLKKCKDNSWVKVDTCPAKTETPGGNYDTGTGGTPPEETPTQDDFDFVNDRFDEAVDENITDYIDVITRNKVSTLILSFGIILSIISGINLMRGKK